MLVPSDHGYSSSHPLDACKVNLIMHNETVHFRKRFNPTSFILPSSQRFVDWMDQQKVD